MIDWVFIDVGNVLFNDDPQNFHGYRLAWERIRELHPGYSFEAMMAEREELARAGSEWNLRRIAQRWLGEDGFRRLIEELREFLRGHYDENHPPNQGLRESLAALGEQWRLGVIANQTTECRRSLERRGLLGIFEVVAISDELALHKPDVRLFEWALAQAGCDPSRCVMIGDRRDNDIAPAQRAGMGTILLRWPSVRSKNWNPDDPLAQLFLDSCDRVPLFSAVPVGPEPDETVASLPELAAAVTALAAQKNRGGGDEIRLVR